MKRLMMLAASLFFAEQGAVAQSGCESVQPGMLGKIEFCYDAESETLRTKVDPKGKSGSLTFNIVLLGAPGHAGNAYFQSPQIKVNGDIETFSCHTPKFWRFHDRRCGDRMLSSGTRLRKQLSLNVHLYQVEAITSGS